MIEEAKQRFGVTSPLGGPTSSGMVTLHCPPGRVHLLADYLRDCGAPNVSVAELTYVYARENVLYRRLEAGLG
jgi:ATP phosphoribosyltransferase